MVTVFLRELSSAGQLCCRLDIIYNVLHNSELADNLPPFPAKTIFSVGKSGPVSRPTIHLR